MGARAVCVELSRSTGGTLCTPHPAVTEWTSAATLVWEGFGSQELRTLRNESLVYTIKKATKTSKDDSWGWGEFRKKAGSNEDQLWFQNHLQEGALVGPTKLLFQHLSSGRDWNSHSLRVFGEMDPQRQGVDRGRHGEMPLRSPFKTRRAIQLQGVWVAGSHQLLLHQDPP